MSSGTLSPGTLSLGTIAYSSAPTWHRARRAPNWSAYLRRGARNGCLSHLIKPGGRRPAYATDAGACGSDAGGPSTPRSSPGCGRRRARASIRRRPATGTMIVGRIDAASVEAANADSGAGIPGEQLNRVFGPFFTTRGDGLGMGPSIARTIVEAQCGRIRPNRCRAGAVFRVAFPLAQPTAG